MRLLALLAYLASLLSCSGYIYQEDNFLEELGEATLKHHTGADVDVSPSEKETGFSPSTFLPFKKEAQSR